MAGTMRVITDVKENLPLLRSAIARFGHSVEHHLQHYLAGASKKNKLLVFSFPKNWCVLASAKGGILKIFPDGVLAPEKFRFALLEKVLSHALLKKGMKKVVIETKEGFRSEILKKMRGSEKFRALGVSYVLYWPIFRMRQFDHLLKGKKWKKMRNIRNRFLRQHRVRMVDAKKVAQEKLRAVVSQWLRKRKQRDRVAKEYYDNVIASKFSGFTLAKAMYVDGKPCAITAGWKVSNGKKHYYSAIGILNYAHNGLGEFANLLDLLLLRKLGYNLVDFGGSGRPLLEFKRKFRPHHVYKTYSFSIVRKK